MSVKVEQNSVILMTVVGLVALILTQAQISDSNEINVTIDTRQIIHITDDRFLSVAIDASQLARHWKRTDLSDPKLLELTKSLEPLYLRVGGTVEDSLYFDEEAIFDSEIDELFDDEILLDERRVLPLEKTIFNGKDWDALNTFVQKLSNTDLYFGLNVLIRKDGAWDPSNAIKLFHYTEKKNYSLNFELGNEPTDFKHKYHVNLSATQLSTDFAQLRNVLNTFSKLKRSKLVGPDCNDPIKLKNLQFFTKFIKHAAPYVNATSWHQYYMNGRIATLNDFVDANLLDMLKNTVMKTVSVTHNVKPKSQVWLGETSSTYGGGTPGLSDSYVAGFMWLDKLGISARYGLGVVIRQSLVHGHYALLDDDFTPRPDFWLSWIYKNLVSKYVLNVNVKPETDKVRLYAHCLRHEFSDYPKNTVILYGMNLMNSDVNINLPDKLINKGAYLYLLTPSGPDGLKSKLVELNGEPLQLREGKKLPPLHSKVYVPLGYPIPMPAKTFGFIALLSQESNICN